MGETSKQRSSSPDHNREVSIVSKKKRCAIATVSGGFGSRRNPNATAAFT